MKKTMSSISVSMLFCGLMLSAVGFAAGPDVSSPESGEGQVSYIKWNLPDFPDSDQSSDVSGAVILSGEAAELMYKHMTNARFDPGAPDLESRHPSRIGRSDCPSKVGTHVICRKIPRMTSDSLVRGADGKVIYDAQCDINVSDVTRGEFKAN
jgi:hypothetical protein